MPFSRFTQRSREENHPFRFLASRVLWRFGLSKFLPLDIRLSPSTTIRFRPFAMAANLWVDPGCYDPQLLYLRRFLRTGDSFIDIGANIGLHSLVAAELVGPTGSVWAFEPHPTTFSYLEENVRRNSLENVFLHPLAVGERNTSARLIEERNDDEHHLGSEGGVPVDVVRLDDVIPRHVNVAVVKIDVEGYETHVLRGGRETLSRVGVVWIEALDRLQRRYGSTLDTLVDELTMAGFDLYEPQATGALVRFDRTSRGTDTNLVALRGPAIHE